ncbi:MULTISPECIES: ATP-binding protein [unclassified Microbacterium]|uniref:sensor histidine kinase n=1 Tax=unclassified Microbacterium TaxID=2609290 RepID=UPI0038699F2C
MTSTARPPRGHGSALFVARDALFWAGTPLLIFALGLVGITLRVPGLPIAAWWPAVGLSLWFALQARPHQRVYTLPLIFIVTVGANVASGRSLLLSAIYGAFNTLEIALVLGLLGAWRTDYRLNSAPRAGRFVISVLLGAIALGLAVGVTAWAFTGSGIFNTAVVAFASHSSAMMLIAPFAALPPMRNDRVNPIEFIAHAAIGTIAIAIAFGPFGSTPLSFLVFAVLTWGALRFPTRVAFVQSLAVAIVALVLTIAPGSDVGVAAADSDSLQAAIALVTFMSTVGIFTVLLVTSRFEARLNAELALRAANDVAAAERARASTVSMQLDLERQREDFVTATSHELRTPTTNILGYSELLVDADLDGDPAEWSAAVHRSATRLKALLDEMPQRSQGPLEHVARVELAPLVDEVRAAHGAEAGSRGAAIHAHVGPELAAMANATDARRALWALVSNAVKFSNDGGVLISAYQEGAEVVIVVTDRGPGMSADSLANAFTRFYRGAEAEAQSTSGLGLGLTTARDLAARNGGDVTLESTPGRGVRASLRLPSAE